MCDQNGVEIDFHSQDIPPELPEDISLALFRVLQEALQNAIKHSGVRHFKVLLSGGSNAIHLTVRDGGAGFDPKDAIQQGGLGLTSMKERLRLLNGDLAIDSRPQHGTAIYATVPLSPRTKSAGA
jgi:signal transduction histidine kinase